jgi:hypothetical protein
LQIRGTELNGPSPVAHRLAVDGPLNHSHWLLCIELAEELACQWVRLLQLVQCMLLADEGHLFAALRTLAKAALVHHPESVVDGFAGLF